jgi:hypothetical protein
MGAIVLTTRASQTQPLAEPLQVEEMDEQTGAAFVLRRARFLRSDQALEEALPQDQQAARQLCQLVGGLPLALDQAGAYIDETQCSFQNYLRFYQRDQHVRMQLLKRRGKITAGHPDPVATTWALAFAKVEQASPAAAELLRACAFLDPDLIPEDLLRQGAPHWEQRLKTQRMMTFCGTKRLENCLNMPWYDETVYSKHSLFIEWFKQSSKMRWISRAKNTGQSKRCVQFT